MANIASAQKRARQMKKRETKNDLYRIKIKEVFKKAKKLSPQSKKKEQLVAEAYATIDRAERENVIHKNKAARLKRQVNTLATTT
ncbi:30S ribosomal protein S20 [Candidatus Woesebacteria bacterium]|nr:30S ribosomal protein S20 [Candidatus Woesebacteria bacterium]